MTAGVTRVGDSCANPTDRRRWHHVASASCAPGPSATYVDLGSQATPERTGSQGFRRSTPTSSLSSWRPEATLVGPTTSSWTPYGVPRPAADSRTQGNFRGPSPQDIALRGVMQSLVRIHACMQTLGPGIVDSRCRPPVVDFAGVKRVARV